MTTQVAALVNARYIAYDPQEDTETHPADY